LTIFRPDVAWSEEKLHRRVPAVPLITVRIDKTGQFGLPIRIVRFLQLRPRAFGSCTICVATHFGNSAGQSTTSSTSNIKGGNSGNNESVLDKGNILKPTFDTLMEEGRKTFEKYHVNLEEFFLSCCEVMQHGTVLMYTTPIVFHRPEVLTDPSPSHNDIQFMIDYALERQANSTDKLMRMLIEERDEKNLILLVLILLLLPALLVLFKPIHTQVVHR
jgi:hypothetical protein